MPNSVTPACYTDLPAIGFGTSPFKREECVRTVVSALEIGYRLIDTAVKYCNEDEVGEAIRRTLIPREELRVTSKLPGRDQAYENAIASVHRSLDRLGLAYIDLHLIHWPNPTVGKYLQAWRALIDLRQQGLIRSVGVSNFSEEHLRRVIDDTGVTPAVNQIELHPYVPQKRMRKVHAQLGIQTESWSPLGRNRAVFTEEPIVAAARKHGVTPAQVILRWQVQIGSIPLPRSARVQHQRENFNIFDFDLSQQEMSQIDAIGDRSGEQPDPNPDMHVDM